MKKISLLLVLSLILSTTIKAQYNWKNVGSGTNLAVNALAADPVNNVVYLGGVFTQAGALPTVGIAKWDGANYSGLGQGILLGSGVYSLLVLPNGDLVAGGSFTNMDGILCKNIAKWNGAIWSPMGLGLDTINAAVVRALAVYKNEIYAGGIFNNSGGFPLSFIAKWNGTSWVPLGSGTNGIVSSLAVYNNELYVGGTFTNAGGIPVNNIAKWDSTVWSDVGGGVNYTGAISVSALEVYSGNLYAGGTFTSAGTTAVKHIAMWDGNNWFDVGGGASEYTGAISVSAFTKFNGNLIVGGTFDSLGVSPANFIGQWNGTNWSTLNQGMNNSVYALTTLVDTLYAGGLFTTADAITTPFVAQWVPTATTTTFLNDHALSGHRFTLYPNPANEFMQIHKPIDYNNGYHFTIYDYFGREVLRKHAAGNILLDTKNFAAGLYLYRITGVDGETLQEGKIILTE